MWMRRLTLLALLVGCTPDPECCETADCSAEGTSGSEVLRFRGEVPRNLLFVSVDTLRKDYATTPFLMQLASEGVWVDDVVQCSNWTAGSMPCWVGGRTNIDRGHLPRSTGLESQRPPVPEGTPFLAGWLDDHVSSLVTINTRFSKDYGNSQGYDQEKWINKALADEAIAQGAKRIKKLSKGGDKPWFLHVHVMEPHLPYNPPLELVELPDGVQPWRETLTGRVWPDYWNETLPTLSDADSAQLKANTIALYDADVRALDQRLEAAFDELDADCLLDDTLVVLFSDHGEAFWEHGFMTHGGNLTAEENDGVLLFWAKNLEPGEWTQTVSSIDLVPTILDLHGIRMPTEVTGMPLGTAPADRPVYAEAIANLSAVQSVVHEGWKLQFNWKSGQVRVWDRNRDPAEMTNLYDPTSERTQALWALMKPEVERMQGSMIGGPDVVWPPDLP